MVKGLYTAHTGMIQEQRRLDVLSNNLANADTNGYKKEGTTSQTFADELAIKIKDTSAYALPRKLGGMSMGVHIGETYTDYTQGNFKVTDNETDIALDGDGFFAIAYTDKQGNTTVKYTRDGAFTVNTEGYLVTKDGDYVLNMAGATNGDPAEGNRIRLDPNAHIVINEFGHIYQNDQRLDLWIFRITITCKNLGRTSMTWWKAGCGLPRRPKWCRGALRGRMSISSRRWSI